jgi:hypothetical protein
MTNVVTTTSGIVTGMLVIPFVVWICNVIPESPPLAQ